MTYPDITDYGLRLPYDLDGAVITSYSITDTGLERTLTSSEKTILNSASSNYVAFNMGNFPAGLTGGKHFGEVRILFPQPMIITAFSLRCESGQEKTTADALFNFVGGIGQQTTGWVMEGSSDARSMADGIWTEPLYPNGDVINGVTSSNYVYADDWRTYVWKTDWTFGPLTAIRFLLCNVGNTANYRRINSMQIYGLRADVSSGEDLEFVESDKTQETSVIDYGNVAYPSSYERSYFIMNTSISKVARNIKLFPLKEDSTRPLDVDLSLITGTYPQPILDADVTTGGVTWYSSSPPATTQGTAEEISIISISINTINSAKPVYIIFTGYCVTNPTVNVNGQTIQVDVYKNDITLMASSQVWVYYNTVPADSDHNFNFVDYLESAGIYTYIFKVWSPGWTGGATSINSSGTKNMTLDVESHALLFGNLGPREAKQIFVRLSPGAGTSPVAYRIEAISIDGWTPQGFAISQAQAQVV